MPLTYHTLPFVKADLRTLITRDQPKRPDKSAVIAMSIL